MIRAVYILLTLLAVSCTTTSSVDLSHFTREVYTPHYATGFEIVAAQGGESVLVKMNSPWQGAQDEEFTILILRGGESAPEGYRGAVIDNSVQRVVTMSSSNLAMFDALSQIDRVVGVSGLDYISSQGVHTRAAEGELFDVGYDSNLNFELLSMLRTDLIMLYSVSGAKGGETAKFDELGITYTYIGDYTEEHPLGKAEWIVVMGELCGERELAQSIFAGVVERYETLKSRAMSVQSRPKVMLNTPYKDVWYLPSMDSYMVRLIEDAGGELCYQDNNSGMSQPISVEKAYSLVSECDYWLNTGSATNSLEDLRRSNPTFSNMAVVKRGDVYNNSARRQLNGGSDFWESGVVNPDLILRDLISILHSELVDEELYYYQKLE